MPRKMSQLCLGGPLAPPRLESPESCWLYLTPFPRKVNTTEFMLHGICLHPVKMQEVLRKTTDAFLRKRTVSLPGGKSWINSEGRPGLANNERPHFSALQKSIFLDVNLDCLLPFSGFHI